MVGVLATSFRRVCVISEDLRLNAAAIYSSTSSHVNEVAAAADDLVVVTAALVRY